MQEEFGGVRRSRIGRAVVATASLIASALGAQMPGAPVLQNAWASPGLVGAINYGGGDGSVYAGAASWASSNARFQLSGGFGARSPAGGGGSKSVYGFRAAIPFGGATSAVGFGAFAGIGGGQTSKGDTISSNTEIPVGVAVGWRRAVGASHGVSIYATPSYVYFSGGTNAGGVARAGVGVDLGITKSLGATAGAEFGGTRAKGQGGPTGTLYGIGLSYAFGRR
jgi:hypothetical protein